MAAASSKKVIFAALAGNSLIALTKFIAFGYTGSSAMLSEGFTPLWTPAIRSFYFTG